jgi:hypothetical protein
MIELISWLFGFACGALLACAIVSGISFRRGRRSAGTLDAIELGRVRRELAGTKTALAAMSKANLRLMGQLQSAQYTSALHEAGVRALGGLGRKQQ